MQTLILDLDCKVEDEVVISLLNMKSLKTLKLKCNDTDCIRLVPHIKQNKTLESLDVQSLEYPDVNKNYQLYLAASHIPHFVAKA